MKRILTCLAFAVVAAGLAPVSAAGQCDGSRYYVLLFGGQGDVLVLRTAHVWATYVRATSQPDGTVCVEPLTISWLPVSGRVRPYRTAAEPGRNYELGETFAFMGSGGRRRIALWGPYEIDERRYCEAAGQKARLEAGAARFRSLDWFDRNADIDHCLHAVTRAHPDLHARCRAPRWCGEAGTAQVAENMVRVGMIADPAVTHDWLIPALGLDREGLVRRTPGRVSR